MSETDTQPLRYADTQPMRFFRFCGSEDRSLTNDHRPHYVIVPDGSLPEGLRINDDENEVLFEVYAVEPHHFDMTSVLVKDVDFDVSEDSLVELSIPVTEAQLQHGAQVLLCRPNVTPEVKIRLGRIKKSGRLVTSFSDRQKLKQKNRRADNGEADEEG